MVDMTIQQAQADALVQKGGEYITDWRGNNVLLYKGILLNVVSAQTIADIQAAEAAQAAQIKVTQGAV